MQQPEIKVYEVKTSELLPYANNAKIHTREQVDQICASIEEFGFNDPVAVWHNADDQMEIIEGHGRVMAAKKLGLQVLPVVYLDHLSDEQRRAYTHVHNQLTMNTEFDLSVLEQEMEELSSVDWEDFGFSDLGISFDADAIFSAEEREESQEQDEDENLCVCPNCGHEFPYGN